VLLGALAAAGRGADADAILLEIATARARGVEESTMALLCLAVGPRRTTPAPALARFADDPPGTYLAAAGALAALRFADRPRAAGARAPSGAGEQVVAALRGSLPVTALHRARGRLGDRAAAPGAALVLRAAFLGPGCKATGEAAALAIELLRQGDAAPE